MKRIFSAVSVLAVATLAIWLFLRSGDDAPANPEATRAQTAMTITLTEAVADLERTRVEAVGSAEARRSITLPAAAMFSLQSSPLPFFSAMRSNAPTVSE